MPKNNQLFVKCLGVSKTRNGATKIIYIMMRPKDGENGTPRDLAKKPDSLIQKGKRKTIFADSASVNFPRKAGIIIPYNDL